MHYSRQAADLTIDEQHNAILACCDDLLSALARDNPLNDVGQLRMRLAGLLHANLALEESQIMAPVRRLVLSDRPEGFSVLVEEAAALRKRYSTHVAQWNLAAIGADLPGYTHAVRGLISLLTVHLAKKRKLLPTLRSCAHRSVGTAHARA